MPNTKTMTVGGTAAALLAIALLPVRVAAADSCAAPVQEQPVRHTVATAALWANVLARPTSIRSESARLLQEARAEALRASPPAGLCPAECGEPLGPEIVFRTVPRKIRSQYSSASYCASKLRETEGQPLRYTRRFASEAELSKWIQDLAMGDGPDGKDLYERCDKSCSPRYTYLIRPDGDSLTVDTSVVCGHARDRDDNKFELSYALRWTCEPVAAAAPGGGSGASAGR